MVKESPRGGCSAPVEPVHACPICHVNMHPWFGTPQENEEFGQPVLCPRRESLVFQCQPHHLWQHLTTPNISTLLLLISSDDDSDDSLKTQSIDCNSHQPAREIVSTIHDRRRVLRWMAEQAEQANAQLFASAVDTFPNVFAAPSRSANLRKALHWWKARTALLELPQGALLVSSTMAQDRKVALTGRGRKPSLRVQWIYPKLLSEFSRLRKLGLQLDSPLLRQVAIQLMKDSKTDRNDKGDLLIDKITPRWIQVFMEKDRMEAISDNTGKKQVSDETMRQIKDEPHIYETHFRIDFDTRKTLGFVGEASIKYADVISEGEGMKMVVRIFGGSQARVLPPMMIFQNANESYPIRGVTDDVGGEECVDELKQIDTQIKFIPPNATDLCQPADSFVIPKLKSIWACKWNAKKFELIKDNAWQMTVRTDGAGSGKL
ncbi:TPA: LOW QUALITY PROTEIN: hypothetical protein N0F65_007272 [Lagenidium giganteum]|uniref:Transposase n=1 Tax=Lagenidium giganteum TaxID=4803 RepID=A0AAV2YW80_9STRA|nr:TPA: LOW QUALITY PROTEIN: hypothetical protein N0F65_007272 [Lagenidium giganteum]